jgi:hypothetical protein
MEVMSGARVGLRPHSNALAPRDGTQRTQHGLNAIIRKKTQRGARSSVRSRDNARTADGNVVQAADVRAALRMRFR